MSRKSQESGKYSKKILTLLAEKPAISLPELVENRPDQKEKYAIKRTLKNLHETGLIEHVSSGQTSYARLTKEGKKKAHSIALDNDTTLVDPNWDGKWRIVMLDLPENRKDERDGLRYLLKKAGFVCLKNSVWISPHPFEHLFMNIKKDLNLTTEIMIFVTDTLDEETKREFAKLILKE